MKIDVICNDGSPLNVVPADVHGENGRIGVGGAELALLTMCEAWAKRGDEVVLYNDPKGPTDLFEQRDLGTFDRGDARDVLVIFRSPNQLSYNAVGKKVWWSCDQYTVGSFKEFAPAVHEIVTISPFHAGYFKQQYGIDRTTVIDLPVRTWEYKQKIERIPNQLIFCSVPDRGLNELSLCWDRIQGAVPEASLVITSDYRLWGASYTGTESYMLKFLRSRNVRFLGAVKRSKLVKLQLQSDIMAYSCTYDELFCIANAECQIAGAYPITSTTGALETTNMGTKVAGNPIDIAWQDAFVETIVGYLQQPRKLNKERKRVQALAKERFSIDKILNDWDMVFNS